MFSLSEQIFSSHFIFLPCLPFDPPPAIYLFAYLFSIILIQSFSLSVSSYHVCFKDFPCCSSNGSDLLCRCCHSTWFIPSKTLTKGVKILVLVRMKWHQCQQILFHVRKHTRKYSIILFHMRKHIRIYSIFREWCFHHWTAYASKNTLLFKIFVINITYSLHYYNSSINKNFVILESAKKKKKKINLKPKHN